MRTPRTQRCINLTRVSSMLLHYKPIAERPGDLPTVIPKSTMTRGMNIIKNTFHISSYVRGLPYVKATVGGFIYESNRWVFGWTKYRHGQRRPSARAFAK
eukprot:5946396-Pyramimonas_sp.AAC.1